MLRQTLFSIFLLLLVGSSVYAADSSEEKAELKVPAVAEETEPELDLFAILGGLEDITAVRALVSSEKSNEAMKAASFGSGGSCYTACNSQFDSICPAGKVSQILATGPINNCGLADIQCVDRCLGPIVSCNQFAQCF